jgi:hypothetical protein
MHTKFQNYLSGSISMHQKQFTLVNATVPYAFKAAQQQLHVLHPMAAVYLN